MNKPIVLFDIDKTLFNGKVYIEQGLFPALEKEMGLNKTTLQQILDEYIKSLPKRTAFDPEAWIDLICQKTQADRAALAAIIYRTELFSASLFPEVKPIIDELSIDYVLGIFSEGVINWQRKKFDNMGIKYYFEQDLLFFSTDKTSDQFLETLPPQVIIVDDNLEMITKAQTREGIHVVWLNRDGEIADLPIRQIRDLTQLPATIEKIRRENPPQS